LLMGESSVLVLGGPRALPKPPEPGGVSFRWYVLEHALGDVVHLKFYIYNPCLDYMA
ncbi:hypothetical protein ACVGWW_14565, partial [Enterobacter hormaechei]